MAHTEGMTDLGLKVGRKRVEASKGHPPSLTTPPTLLASREKPAQKPCENLIQCTLSLKALKFLLFLRAR